MNRPVLSQQHLLLLIAAVCVLTTGSLAGAQDYEELFAQTDDQSFGFFDDASGAYDSTPNFANEATDPAAERESLPAPDRAVDRDPPRSPRAANNAVRSPSDLRLSDQSGSQVDRQRAKVMQLRQARARAEERSRIARLEAERWGLRPDLRPSWSTGMMSNGYHPANITYFVPVYVWGR